MKKLLFLVCLLSLGFSHAQIITTVVGTGYGAGTGMGNYSGEGVPATTATMHGPYGLAIDAGGNLFVSENVNTVIRKINANDTITKYGGIPLVSPWPYSSDGGDADTTQLIPRGMTIDPSGNLVFADANNVIRKINSQHIVSTVAGNYLKSYPWLSNTGGGGYGGDGGPADSAMISDPMDIAYDHKGNLFIADYFNHLIRRVDVNGIITTYAGDTTGIHNYVYNNGPCNCGYSGDGGPATSAKLRYPTGVTCDRYGNVYVADNANNLVRKIDTLGMISTVAGYTVGAGTGSNSGFTGNGGPATLAKIALPSKVCFDSQDNMYIAESWNNVVRKVNSSGIITAYVGTGAKGYTGDNGPAVSATLNEPYYVLCDNQDNLFIADWYNNVVRKVTLPNPLPTPVICMVSTDISNGFKNNIIYWDNSLYPGIDSFIVYRKDVFQANYLRIGATASSQSQWMDTAFSIGGPNGGNPQFASWNYKLALKSVGGQLSNKSPYHQTAFFQQNGSNFSWNAYGVESGQTNPVLGYSFLRDDNNNGNWNVLVNTSATSTTDPNFSSYPNGNWRVDILGFNCITNAAHSNTSKLAPIGIETSKSDEFTLFPNPATSGLYIKTSLKVERIAITDVLGTLKAEYHFGKNSLERFDVSELQNGIYFLTLASGNTKHTQKFIVQH